MPLPGPNNTVVERVWISAGQHLLEGELAYGEDMPAPRGAAVLACSHPLLGGSMHNNVIRGLGDGLAERGLVTLRFNYRGVGGSQGPTIDAARPVAEFWKTSHVPGELSLWQDVQAAIGFLRRSTAAVLPLTLIGYSFGSALLPYLGPAAAYVLIAPPLNQHDYEGLLAVRAPILVIVSESDFTHNADRLRSWFDRLPAPKRLVQTPGDNHFFRGQEPWLMETVFAFLQDQAGVTADDANPAATVARQHGRGPERTAA
jgi:alpha/beta superfamily hydrolase